MFAPAMDVPVKKSVNYEKSEAQNEVRNVGSLKSIVVEESEDCSEAPPEHAVRIHIVTLEGELG